jgi:hypothetical protein
LPGVATRGIIGPRLYSTRSLPAIAFALKRYRDRHFAQRHLKRRGDRGSLDGGFNGR